MDKEDLRNSKEVQALLDKGREDGALSYEEINDSLGKLLEGADDHQVEDILQLFQDEGIDLVSSEDDDGVPGTRGDGDAEPDVSPVRGGIRLHPPCP